MEHKGLYKTKGEIPEGEYFVPIGKAAVVREGSALTVLTYGNMTFKALEAAKELSSGGVEIEVVDLRTVHPLDEETIVSSVRKTGRAIVFHEARKTGGLGGEVAALIAEKAFGALKAPVVRVAGPDVPANFPRDKDDLIAGVNQILAYKG
jgi:pyruvate dehydrogenase E1 component beta subunit